MGLVNWDYLRQQRDSDFRAEGRIVLVAEVVSLIATATAAILLRDFTAILYGLIGRAAMTVIMSHAVARQRYAAGYARAYAPRLARFAWPLLLNGLPLFICGQGVRIFISNLLGVSVPGNF